MTPAELFHEFEAGFARRKFSAGLLIAFIDFYKDLGVPGAGHPDLDQVLAAFPKQETTTAGHRANTLIVAKPDGATLSLRPFYNAAERFFRAEHHRFDYPSCAPHATQAWGDYRRWLDALATFSPAEIDELRDRVANFVLDTLADQAFDPSTVVVDPPLFRLVLEDFDMTARRGEPTGAAYQGIVFGFLRADNPHLQVEIDKVRTGSARLQRIGDIDAWEGARLAISTEVKQYVLEVDAAPDLEGFANKVGERGAIGIVASLGYADGAREAIEALGLRAIDRGDMLRIVELWDPLKQRTATQSLIYYARHVEKNSSLADRIEAFLSAAAAPVAADGAA
jgi:hypothetical protein